MQVFSRVFSTVLVKNTHSTAVAVSADVSQNRVGSSSTSADLHEDYLWQRRARRRDLTKAHCAHNIILDEFPTLQYSYAYRAYCTLRSYSLLAAKESDLETRHHLEWYLRSRNKKDFFFFYIHFD